MKKRNVFAVAIASLALALGVGAGLKANKVQEVKADSAPYVGSVCIEFQALGGTPNYWDDSNAKVAFYAFNNSTSKPYGWSSMITTKAGTHNYEISYSFENDPFTSGTQFHLVRFNSSHSDTPDWNDIWNRYDNITFSQVMYMYNDNGVKVSAQNQVANYLVSNGSANNVRLSFNKFSTNVECYRNMVSIAKDEQFTIKFNNAEYHELKSGVSATYFKEENNKIVCNVTGTYDLFFDTNTKKLWVQVDSVTEAAGFAHTFLDTTDLICKDSSLGSGDTVLADLQAAWNKKATPDGTSLVEKWEALTSGAKSAFGSNSNSVIASARERYIVIMQRYGSPTLTAFTDGPSYSSNVVSTLAPAIENSTNIALIIVIVSTISLVALGGFFFIKRKKEN